MYVIRETEADGTNCRIVATTGDARSLKNAVSNIRKGGLAI